MKRILLKFSKEIKIWLIIGVFIIPLIIHLLFKIDAVFPFFVAEWTAGDALSFYGTLLATTATIIGVYISVEHAQKSYHQDEINRVKPYMALTHYKSRSNSSFLDLGESDHFPDEDIEPSHISYEEYIVNKVYIVLGPEGIIYREKLDQQQHALLQYNGYEIAQDTNVLQHRNYLSMPFSVENVGNGASTNSCVALYHQTETAKCARVYTVKPGTSFYIHIFCADVSIIQEKSFVLELKYGDILGNLYSQKYPISLTPDEKTGGFSVCMDLTGKQELVEGEE